MKRALITLATVGILAPTAWVAGANAQYGAPAPAYGPSRRYARRAYRRTARQTYRGQNYGAPPAVYSGGTAFTPGSGGQPYAVTPRAYTAQSAQPNEWYAAPGPMRRGNMCVTHVDSLRGYGFQSACPPPKAAAARAPVRSARRPSYYGAPPAVYAVGTLFSPGPAGAPYAVATGTDAPN